jgi:hypothetical protein
VLPPVSAEETTEFEILAVLLFVTTTVSFSYAAAGSAKRPRARTGSNNIAAVF